MDVGRRVGEFGAARLPELLDLLQDLQEAGPAVSGCPAGNRCRRKKGFRSGVRNTFSGQPPWPVVAWTKVM